MKQARTIVALAALGLALLAPTQAQALPRGFFGIAPQTALGPGDTARMRVGGVETIRVQINWSLVQPTPRSDFDWSGFDSLMATAARDRLEVLPVLYGVPGWVSGDYRRLPIYNDRQRRGWSRFVRAAVERYGRHGSFWREHGRRSERPLPKVPIRAWQIWNEQNFFYFTRPASPRRYASLLKISDRAVRRGDRRAEIVTGGLFGDPSPRPPRAMDAARFLNGLYRVRGIKARFDAVALHPYAADTRALRRLVESVRRVMVRNGDRRSGLYLTELGWGSERNPRVSFEVGWRPQARELRRSFRYLIGNQRRLNLKQIDWFSWKDHRDSCDFCDSTGLFRAGERFRAKPAWRAYRGLARKHGR